MGNIESTAVETSPSAEKWWSRLDFSIEPGINSLRYKSVDELFREEQRNFLQDLGNLLTTGKGSDLVLEAGGKTFKAHKAVLAARSPAFGDASEEGVIRIQDADGPTVDQLLKYIYKSEVPQITVNNLAPMMKLAEKYELARLAKFCRSQVTFFMSEENFCDVLNVGLDYSNGFLQHACEVFFRFNTSSCMETQQWKDFAEKNPGRANAFLTAILNR